ncbi:MAG: DUF1996 domain-containing protein [Actinomycetota bacterium]
MRVSVLVVLITALAAGLVATGPPAGAANPAKGGFIVTCDYSHTASDDPIVYPGQPGASHSHDFFGNESTSSGSTYESMEQAPSNCGVATDTAGYWAPTPSLNGTEIHAKGVRGDMRIYYRVAGADRVETIPAGLEMVAGSKDATAPPPAQVLRWYCGAGAGGTTPFSSHPYDCTSYAQQFDFVDGVVAIVNLQRCWDGNGLGPSDVEFPIAGGIDCPDGFPHLLPQVSERIHFGIMDPCAGFTPCGPTDPDVNVRLTMSSGPYYTLHVDFWNAWHQDVLDRLVEDCLNAHESCSFLGSHYKVSVSQTGTGTGTITSDPAGISCGSTCFAAFDTSTHVTLTAVPSEGSQFSGWSGDCVGTDPCTLLMEHQKVATAVFNAAQGQTYTLSVTPEGEGHGTVTSEPAGLSCGDTCSATFDPGTTVYLTATPDQDSLFAGWSRSCSGAEDCAVTMNKDRFVNANFIPREYRPDASIRFGHHRLVGDGVRGASGAQQTVTAKAKPGSKLVFTISTRNRGNASDGFVFRGGGDHGPFTVRYLAGFSGGTGITTQVILGTYRTAAVTEGENRVIRLVVQVPRTAKAHTEWTWQVVAASTNRSVSRDVVRAHVLVVEGPHPKRKHA